MLVYLINKFNIQYNIDIFYIHDIKILFNYGIFNNKFWMKVIIINY